MSEKNASQLTQEELEQVRKAMEEFGNEPLMPVVKPEVGKVSAEAGKRPGRKPKRWIPWVAAVVAVALAAGIGYGYWAGLPYHHPNSMANRRRTVDVDGRIVALINDDSLHFMGSFTELEVSEWTDVVAVSAGSKHVVGLRQDGTVVFAGDNASGGECRKWTNMRAVAAGGGHTVGLKDDGTVIALGSNVYGQCAVSKWKNMIGIATGKYFTAGVRFDGTVCVTQVRTVYSNLPDATKVETLNATLQELAVQLEKVQEWKDIISVAVSDTCILGLKTDGTVVAAGINDNGQCDVEEWKDIVSVETGSHMSVGVRADGTMVTAGGGFELGDESDENELPLSEQLAALTAQYSIVDAWCPRGVNIYFLCTDGTLYCVSLTYFSGSGESKLYINKTLTDARLP